MREFQNIAASAFSGEQRLCCVLQTILTEIPQKRIAGAERQKSKCNSIAVLQRFWKNPVHDFVAGAVTADGNKISISLRVGITRKMRSITRARSVYRVHFYSGRTQFI